MKIFHLLEDECHSYDMQLAFLSQPQSTTSSFTDYCIELQKLQLMKAECAEAQDSLRGLEEVTTYVAICLGEKDPISADYIKQVKEKRQSVKAMVRESKYFRQHSVLAQKYRRVK